MQAEKIARSACWAVLAALALWPTSCTYFVLRGGHGFDQVSVGDTRSDALRAFGLPSVSQSPGQDAGRTPACRAPCAERLWFDNKVSLLEESWIVDIGADGKVVAKNHVISP